MIDFHDKQINKYEYDLIDKRLSLHLKESTKLVLFKEVLAFDLYFPLPGSTILEISKSSNIETLYEKNYFLFSRGKEYMWPIDYENKEDFFAYFYYNKYTIYYISASYGANGWVIAKSMN